MSDNPEDYELVHYGVKGMKWGRRKAEAAGSAVKSGAKRVTDGYKGLSDEKKAKIKTGAKVAGGAVAIAGSAIVSSIVAKKGMVPESSLAPYAADKMEKYIGSHYMNDPVEFGLMVNYTEQVRRGDY